MQEASNVEIKIKSIGEKVFPVRKILLFLTVLTFLLMGSVVIAQEGDNDLNELARYNIDEAGNLSLMSGVDDPAYDDLWILMLVLLPTDYVDQYLYTYNNTSIHTDRKFLF